MKKCFPVKQFISSRHFPLHFYDATEFKMSKASKHGKSINLSLFEATHLDFLNRVGDQAET